MELQIREAEDWSEERVLSNGTETIDQFLHLIQRAKESIRFEVYIFHNDTCGDVFIEELAKAARKGVKVRLLLDGFGSWGFPNSYLEALRRGGVEVKFYHSSLRLFGRLNKRNHRKVLIADDKTVVTGSVNVSKCHLSRERGGGGWRDTAVLLEGQPVQLFITAFERSWENANRIAPRPAPSAPLIPAMFNFSAKLRKLRYLLVLELIYRAERRVWISNAYFVPDGSLLKALRFASWSGTDVRIIVPKVSDVYVVKLVSSAFYLGLLSAGVRIYEYLPSVLHAKTLVIDNIALVGTTNLNHRSLFHDLEVDVVLKKTSSIESLSKAFESDLENCKEVSIKDWQSRPLFERWMGNLLLFVRYWL